MIATIGSIEWTRIDARLAAQRISDVPVDAVIVGVPALSAAGHDVVATGPTAPAVWSGRDGRPSGGQIHVPATTNEGEHVTIWLDPAGAVVAEPMGSTAEAALTVLTAAVAWGVLGFGLTAVWWLMRRRLDRTRLEIWAIEWAAFSSGHRPA